jgi:hypothetical protein
MFHSIDGHLGGCLGAFDVWVHEAVGPFWVFLEGFLSWAASLIKAATFAVLVLRSIELCFDIEFSTAVGWSIKASFMMLCCGLSMVLGAKKLGRFLFFLFALMIILLLVFSGMALLSTSSPSFDWRVLGQTREALDDQRNATVSDDDDHQTKLGSYSSSITSNPSHLNWEDVFMVVFWSVCNGCTNIVALAAKSKLVELQKTFPKAIVASSLFMILTYLIPLMSAAVYNEPNWTTWHIGSLHDIATAVGGTPLKVAILIASLASHTGAFISAMCITTMVYFQFQSTQATTVTQRHSGPTPSIEVDDDTAPAAQAVGHTMIAAPTAARTIFSRVGTTTAIENPHKARTHVLVYVIFMLVHGLPLIGLIALPFHALLAVTNVLSALSQVLVVAAALYVRRTHSPMCPPHGHVPWPFALLVAYSTPPCLLTVALIYAAGAASYRNISLLSSVSIAALSVPVLIVGLVSVGTLAAFLVSRQRQRRRR